MLERIYIQNFLQAQLLEETQGSIGCNDVPLIVLMYLKISHQTLTE